MKSDPSLLPLHLCTLHKSFAIINRTYALLHFTALIFLITYRLSSFPYPSKLPQILPHLIIFASELLLSLIWLCTQAYLWRPVSRTTFQERLPEDNELPPVDVFICTADPRKEPAVQVMNTVLSAMVLDYPVGKISVYVSDDGGSYLTLKGMREARRFARFWVPFCRRYGIKCGCPKAYFSGLEEDDGLDGHSGCVEEYHEELDKVKAKYKRFKERLKKAAENGEEDEEKSTSYAKYHLPLVEVIRDESDDEECTERVEMPLLVYVSREKKPSHPHHFKAGALNVLLRISGIMTNSPYILVLDCDMYCNDPTSARQAMCFHLDPKLSPSLAFVQFPQKFHNVNRNDLYDGQSRTTFMVRWPGADGLQGPLLSGTGFYMKREALYGDLSLTDPMELKQSFGHSNEFISSIHQHGAHHIIVKNNDSLRNLQQEAQFVANCDYEKHTLWGQEVGFFYHTVVEDYFTGFILHCKGWRSVFCNPSRPAFFGSSPINLNDSLIQGARWNSGVLEVALSRFCPFVYGIWRMPLLQAMCYGYYSLHPLYCLPLWCFSTLPQLCLLNGIPLYPNVSSAWFLVFSFIFLASLLKHLEEVVSTGGFVKTWWNEQRIWMMKSVTAYTYGSLDAVLKCIGVREASFLPTNKVADDEQVMLYQMGKLNFQASTMLLLAIVTLVALNMVCLIGGAVRMGIYGGWRDLFGQVMLSLYILIVNFAVIEGMLMRKDVGRVPFCVSLFSLVCAVTLCLGSVLLLG